MNKKMDRILKRDYKIDQPIDNCDKNIEKITNINRCSNDYFLFKCLWIN